MVVTKNIYIFFFLDLKIIFCKVFQEKIEDRKYFKNLSILYFHIK